MADVLRPLVVPAGHAIVRQGTAGFEFYLIEEGRVHVLKAFVGGGPGVLVKALGVGEYFGELALLYDEPRQATVVAQTEVRRLLL